MPRGKQRGKPSNRARTVEHEIAVQGMFEALETALEARDAETVQRAIQELKQHRTAAAKECERRLLKPRSSASVFLVDLLQTLTIPKHEAALHRVAKNRTAPDYVRFSAQRLAGWNTTDVAGQRLTFLDSLSNPTGILTSIASAEMTLSVDGIAAIEEVLRYLQAMPANRRLGVVANMADAMSESFTSLASALAHVDDPQLQELVIAWLREHSSGPTVGVLERVSRTAIDPGIRLAAAEAAFYSTGNAGRQATDREIEQIKLPAIGTTMLSNVDSDGEQIVVLSRERAPGWIGFVQLYWDDTTGVRDIFGVAYAPAESLEDIRDDFEAEGRGAVEASPGEVRGIFQAALEVSARTGHPLPPEFELWEPFIHDAWPVDDNESVETTELDDAPFAGRDDLVAASAELFEHEWFST